VKTKSVAVNVVEMNANVNLKPKKSMTPRENRGVSFFKAQRLSLLFSSEEDRDGFVGNHPKRRRWDRGPSQSWSDDNNAPTNWGCMRCGGWVRIPTIDLGRS
jgi:hypothetical protein